MENLDNNHAILKQKTYNFAIKIGIVFFLTSIAGIVLGNLLDAHVFSRPLGTIISMAICYVITWVFVWRIYKQFKMSSKSSSKSNSPVEQL